MTGTMAVGTDQGLSLPAVVQETDVTVSYALMSVGLLVWFQS